ncbi:hypothetical protein SEPCBS57363_000597 [Sporothrix epigloea]|uniref:Pentatricopeptide repeat protein n=1 Tax=Sporothrix epigloea TaxID=1892477 RepID=A0ABP0D5M4_9PEZI
MQACPCLRLRLWRQQHCRPAQSWRISTGARGLTATATNRPGSTVAIPEDTFISPSHNSELKDSRWGTQGGYALHYKFRRTAVGGKQLKAKRATEPQVKRAKMRLKSQKQKRSPKLAPQTKGKLSDPFHPGQQAYHTRRLELRPTTGGSAELVETIPLNAQATAAIEGTSRRLKKLIAANGDRARPTIKYVMAQWRRVQRTTSPGDLEAARKAFWSWRKSLEETRRLLRQGELLKEIPEDFVHSNELWKIIGRCESGGDGSSDNTECIQEAKAAWEALSEQQRSKDWPEFVNKALRSGPQHAYVFLMATFDAATMPLYVVEDAIHFLAQSCLSATTGSTATASSELSYAKSIKADDVFALLRAAFGTQPPIQELKLQEAKTMPRLLLQQATVFHLTRILGTPEAARDLYRLLTTHGHAMYKYTRLQMAWQLARSAQLAHRMQALEILQDALASTNLDINSPQSASVCTAILTVHENESDSGQGAEVGAEDGAQDGDREPLEPLATPAEMFEALLRCGLEPNLIMYTTLIRGLCLRHELHAAQQVLELMVKNQIDPDDTVYSIMMNGAKTCGNVSTLQRVAASAAAHGVRHPYVWNDFLQAIYQTAHSEVLSRPSSAVSKHIHVVPAFPLMLQAYTRMFSREPLETLLPGVFSGLDSLGSEQTKGSAAADRWEFIGQFESTLHSLPQLPPTALIEPTSPALATMVLGYIQNLSKPYEIISFYSHLRRLLQARDPTTLRLIQSEGTRIHDIVIMALCKHEGMLRATLDVVGDMLRDASAVLEGEDPGHLERNIHLNDTLSYGHPAPSIYTWSILLNGFMVHRQTRQGERILKMMRDRGVEPNLVTWNSLLAGYARAQRPQETARAVLRLERAGHEPDEYTIRAFSYLVKKASALQLIEENRAAETAGRKYYTASVSGGAAAKLGSAPAAATSAVSAVAPSIPTDIRYGTSAGSWGEKPATVAELHDLENEVEEIAKMMDKEQRDGSCGSAV